MKTVIIFSTSHGTTEKVSYLLKENLKGDVDLINLRNKSKVNLEEYDSIIIGGSIHAGSIQPKVKNFIKKNKNILSTKKLGLFLCCMFEGDKAIEQFKEAYPEELRKVSVSNGLFGGELIFSKMNFFEKLIVKKVSGITSDTSRINIESIKNFAEKFN